MTQIALSIILVLLIIYIVPMVVYGLSSALIGAKMPEGVSPMRFLLSVLISKIGTAIAFVLIFYFAHTVFSELWPLYSFIWWLMFSIGEIGQTIGPNYSWKEAVAGVISEAIYFPLAALVANWLISVA
jgi:hypothetical protein